MSAKSAMGASGLFAICLAVGVAFGLDGAFAQGFDFRDRTFLFSVVMNYEERDLVDQSTYHAKPDWVSTSFEAVNGKIAWVGHAVACPLSLVYLPGGSFSGQAVCQPKREGTASNWKEKSSTATFRTTTKVEGNVITLHGEMSGTDRFRMNHCGLTSSDATQFTVSQTVKLRIGGGTCQVLEFSQVETADENGTLDGRPTHKTTRAVFGPASSCQMEQRSSQPPSDDELEDFDMACP